MVMHWIDDSKNMWILGPKPYSFQRKQRKHSGIGSFGNN
jgi:hypothetical protein